MIRLIFVCLIINNMLVLRRVEDAFKRLSSTHKIVAVVGPRQAGKTTFLREQMAQGQRVTYTSLDDPNAKALFDEDLKKFEMQFLDSQKINIIDEAQYGDSAGSKLKHLADSGTKLWVSASSQMLLEAKVLSHLAGRVGILELYPFSLNEFLEAKGQKAFTKAILDRIIWEHAVYGGYPQVVLELDLENKKLLLKNLFTTVLLKDAFRSFGIEDQPMLERLARFLAINFGAEFRFDSVSRSLGLSVPTLQKYVWALEKSYLVKRVQPFFTNKSLELVKQPKLYFLDCGMRNAVIGEFPSSLDADGRLFENYVFSELCKLGLQINYWKNKNKAEVDFVVSKGNEHIPIEVKLFSDLQVERSLRSFIERYSPPRAFVVAYEGKKESKTIGKTNVEFTDVHGLVLALSSP
jgi:predicted AAA+ superfamily ATPase